MDRPLDAPLVFLPRLKERVWGGSFLRGRAPEAPSGPIGESWEICDREGDVSRTPDGVALDELALRRGDDLMGAARDPRRPELFPLLLKLIDASEDLSVQVHPDDGAAAPYGDSGKTEAWYVLDAAPGARVFRGLAPGAGRRELEEALAAGTVAGLLHAVPVARGDVVFVPAGTIHALGAGVRVVEFQQNSDLTFRVFDWNRLGLDGKARTLHVAEALAVARFDDAGPDLAAPLAESGTAAPTSGSSAAAALRPPRREVPLGGGARGCRARRFVRHEALTLDALDAFERPVALDTEGARFHLLTVVAGEATIVARGGCVRRGPLDSALVPAAAGRYELRAAPGSTILLASRP